MSSPGNGLKVRAILNGVVGGVLVAGACYVAIVFLGVLLGVFGICAGGPEWLYWLLVLLNYTLSPILGIVLGYVNYRRAYRQLLSDAETKARWGW